MALSTIDKILSDALLDRRAAVIERLNIALNASIPTLRTLAQNIDAKLLNIDPTYVPPSPIP